MGSEISFLLNEREVRTGLPAGTVLLDFIRGEQRLTGTRQGCREGDCGACTVLLGTPAAGGVAYKAVVSCLLPLAEAEGRHVVTIEGLNGSDLNPVQQAIVSEGGSQCGFCTPGIVVSLTGFLLHDRELRADDAITAMEGNICRCTGYASLKRAVARLLRGVAPALAAAPDRLAALVGLGVLPEYFAAVAGRLAALPAPQAPPPASAAALVVAGGTDLYVQRNAELPGRELQLLSSRPGFAGVWPAEGSVAIGAATTVSDMMAAPVLNAALPGLAACLRRVSSAAIRNRATLGGNIANASPIGDLSVMFLALDARVGLRGAAGNRELALRDLFLGYKKLDVRKDEVLAWISVPLARNGVAFHFEKVARRRNQDIASVNSALGLETAGGRIVAAHVAAGGVAPVPLYLAAASAFLAGKEVSAGVVREMAAAADAEIAPISDVRGAASYKRALLRRLLFAHFLELFPERVAAEELL